MHSVEMILFEQLAKDRHRQLEREAEADRLARAARAGARRHDGKVGADTSRGGKHYPREDAFREFWRGFVVTLPLWIGILPFGVAYAMAARGAGLSAAETIGMSLLVYAGTSQLVATELLASEAGALSIVLATLLINARLLPLAASLAGSLGRLPASTRGLLAFTLSDPSYAVSVERVARCVAGWAFLAGSGVSLYTGWQLGTLAGLAIGSAIADVTALGLELVFPLSFLSLLAPYVRSRSGALAALVAGGLALVARLVVPGTAYLVIGIVGGSLAGALVERRR
jgi:4-azaleucine resistance transporter AzlC